MTPPAPSLPNAARSLVNEILTEQQLDRYSAFRRSSVRKGIQVGSAAAGAPRQQSSCLPGVGCCSCRRAPALCGAASRPDAPPPFPHAAQLLMTKTLGGAPNSKALIALSSVAKSFVDDLVATGERPRSHGRRWVPVGRPCVARCEQ